MKASHKKPWWRHKLFPLALFIGLPTLLSALYYALFAADQYQTEALISVRAAHGTPTSSLLGTILSGGTIGQSSVDANTISKFVVSHDAVRKLNGDLNLKEIYSKPRLDFWARLSASATFEELVEYYGTMVESSFDSTSGNTHIRVRAFAPEDAQAIAVALIEVSEELVNSLNLRAEEDALRLARSEMSRAETALSSVRQRMQQFRLTHRDIDPAKSTRAIGEIIAGLEAQHAATSAELSEMSSYMKGDSLQVEAMRRKAQAIEQQIIQEQQKLTGQDSATTDVLAQYEALILEHELANRAYASAIASLERARVEAQQQYSYVVPVVSPHRPEEAQYPLRWRGVLFVFLGSTVIYGIGRLLVLGVYDHVMH